MRTRCPNCSALGLTPLQEAVVHRGTGRAHSDAVLRGIILELASAPTSAAVGRRRTIWFCVAFSALGWALAVWIVMSLAA